MVGVGACRCNLGRLSSADCSRRRRIVSIIYFGDAVKKIVFILIADAGLRRLAGGDDEVHTNERHTQQASFSGNWQAG